MTPLRPSFAREIVGRHSELAAVDAFLDETASGAAALVLSGPAGIGKSTLWKAALAAARNRGFVTLETRAVEAEAQLAFSGLTDLLEPLASRGLERLPPAQRVALEVALQRVAPDGSARPALAVPLATLALLRDASAVSPVILAVDDLPWIDAASARALAYVMRRLEGPRVGVLVAIRSDAPDAGPPDAELPQPVRRLHVGPLDANAIDVIVQRALDVQLRPPALRRIEKESGGNPFLALEIAQALVRAGGVSGLDVLPLPAEGAALVRHRLEQLPENTLKALAAAAALSQPTLELVAQAVDTGGEAVTAAVAAGVVEVEAGRIRFTHPLLAAGAYQRLDESARRSLHARLAGVVTDVEQRARHLALSSTGADAGTAADLEVAARDVWSRGAPDTAAELMVIASQRTPGALGVEAARRMAAAGGYFIEAGDPARARSVLEAFVGATPPGPERAEVLFVLADARSADSWEAKLRLLDQALEEGGDNHRLRAEILASRLGARWVACDDALMAVQDGLDAVAEAEQQDDLAVRSAAYRQAAFAQAEAGQLRNDEFIERAVGLEPEERHLRLARGPRHMRATSRDRLEEAVEVLEGLRVQAITLGDIDSLPLIEWDLGMVLSRLGRWTEARAIELEAERRTRQTGQLTGLAGILANRAFVEAGLGNVDEARAAIEEAEAIAESIGARMFLAIALAARAFLGLATGDLQAVDTALLRDASIRFGAGYRGPWQVRSRGDWGEALVGLGRLEEASSLLGPMEDVGERFELASVLAGARRVRGLIAAARGDEATSLAAFQEALALHARRDEPFERGRTLLAQGEALRRFRQKAAARASLEQARALFTALPAPAWIERTKAELARTGRREAGAPLSATQQQVADLVAAGRTNREVAEALFMSPHTVEAHLTAIYRALGVRGRTELANRLRPDFEGSD